MKRDMDLAHTILLELDQRERTSMYDLQPVTGGQGDDETKALVYYLTTLVDGGFLKGTMRGTPSNIAGRAAERQAELCPLKATNDGSGR